MSFPIGDLFSIISFLIAGAQTCLSFENDLMATCKRSKETNADGILRMLSIWISNAIQLLKKYVFQLKLYEKGNRTKVFQF